MSINLGSKAAFLMIAAAAFAVSFAPTAQATPINYDFTVNIVNGPLSGTVANGSLSYDSSSVIPGGINKATGLLTSLNFTFNGITYNASTANTGALTFDSAGNLYSFLFGTDCVAGQCTVTGLTDSWYANAFNPRGGFFVYSVSDLNYNYGRNPLTFAPASVSVPEPGTLGLFGFGLLLLGVAGWRRSANRRVG